jgi:hypothetical protein
MIYNDLFASAPLTPTLSHKGRERKSHSVNIAATACRWRHSALDRASGAVFPAYDGPPPRPAPLAG